MEMRYCIECERNVCVDVPEGHTIFVPVGDGQWEVDFCYSTFATVAPPVNFEEDWDLQVVPPSEEELAIMNLNAEVLYQDFDYMDLKF